MRYAKYLALGVLTCILLVGFYVMSGAAKYRSTLLVPSTSASQGSYLNSLCPSLDQSFCLTENRFRAFVQAEDFSDILENEVPQLIACNAAGQQNAYCQGVESNLTIQLFRVYYGSQQKLMTRNEYITSSIAYFLQHQPLHFTQDHIDGAMATMQFSDNRQLLQYELVFTKTKTGWMFVAPVFEN